MSKKDERHDITIQQYIASLDDGLQTDTRTIMQMMQRISGEYPILYGIGTIGYGVYKYEYASGRKGEAHTLGFYPRAGKITVYLMDGTARYSELLAKLGKHTTTGYCVYIKHLSDVELPILQQILQKSYEHIESLSKKGPIDHILWQAEK
ncbi:MAG: DUF1801 domain-containing protein [Candidatus Saccharibacteria bacterium]|nr:DUF1801 domain-containing protein [Candidatus Saccharibacteria bacterium]